jgi:hypothetical protein
MKSVHVDIWEERSYTGIHFNLDIKWVKPRPMCLPGIIPDILY